MGEFLQAHHATFTAANISELSLSTVRQKLKLDGSSSLPPSPAPNSIPYFSTPLAGHSPVSPAPAAEDPDDERPPVVPLKAPRASLTDSMEGLGITAHDAKHQLASPPLTPNSPPLSYREPATMRNQTFPGPPPRTTSNGHHSPGAGTRPGYPGAPSPEPPMYPSTAPRGNRLSPTIPPSSSSTPPPPISSSSSPGPSPPHLAGAIQSTANDAERRPGPRVVSPDSARDDREAFEAERRTQVLQEREDVGRLEREKRERDAAELARDAAEREARARWESEQRERERLDGEERTRLEREEGERREAAERLRREEVRRAEAAESARRKEEEERERIEEEVRTREAREQMRLLIEQERLERKMREEEEIRAKAAAREAERKALLERFEAAARAGSVMLTGYVTVQGGASLVSHCIFYLCCWELTRVPSTVLEASVVRASFGRPAAVQIRIREHSLAPLLPFKSPDCPSIQDATKAIEIIALPNRVKALTDNPEEASMAHSFKLSFKGEDDDSDFLFYTDEQVHPFLTRSLHFSRLMEFSQADKEVLAAAIKMAAKL